ncbi:hypothetical protein GN956_G18618 [Arapaima gigas]
MLFDKAAHQSLTTFPFCRQVVGRHPAVRAFLPRGVIGGTGWISFSFTISLNSQACPAGLSAPAGAADGKRQPWADRWPSGRGPAGS